MPKPVLVVGFDGSEPGRRALDFCAEHAALLKARVHVVLVIEWSPYSFLTPEELDERSKQRKVEVERAEKVLAPVVKQLGEKGIEATHEVRYGHAGEVLCEIAEKQKASSIVIGRTGGSGFTQRLLGGLAMTLVQASPVPVIVVP